MIIVPIVFSIVSAHCINRRELHSAIKMQLRMENIVITQKYLRSKHTHGTTSAASQFKMRRAEWWAGLNIPGHLATLKGENSR